MNGLSILTNSAEIENSNVSFSIDREQKNKRLISESKLKIEQLDYNSSGLQLSFSDNVIETRFHVNNAQSEIQLIGTTGLLEGLASSFTDIKYHLMVSQLSPSLSEWNKNTRSFSEFFAGSKSGAQSGKPVYEQWIMSLPPGIKIQLSNLSFKYQGREMKLWVEATIPAAPDDGALDFVGRLHAITLQARWAVDESIIFDLMESRTRDVINRTDEFGQMEKFSDAEAAPLVVGSVESQLKILLREGYLDFHNGFYSAHLSVQDGRVSINGKPFLLGVGKQ